MNTRAVLFDLDGTLTDSGPGVMASVAHAFTALGRPPPGIDEARRFVGPPLRESFEAVGLDPVAAIGHYREYFTDKGIYENSVYAGIVAVLDDLAAAGLRLAVATSKPTVFARRILDHFDLLASFEAVWGDELDGSRRHKHLVIAAALADLRVAPVAAVMVGDRAADVIGAARCGVPFVGAGWGYGEPGELHAAGAGRIADTPAALPDLLARGRAT